MLFVAGCSWDNPQRIFGHNIYDFMDFIVLMVLFVLFSAWEYVRTAAAIAGELSSEERRNIHMKC